MLCTKCALQGIFCRRRDREAQGCIECKQTPTATPCALPAGLIEWRFPARLIEWREEQAEASEGDGDIVKLKFGFEDFLTPLAAEASAEDVEDAEGKADTDVMEIVGGAEVLEPGVALEDTDMNGDSDVMEVIRTVERSEAAEVAEAATAEQQVQISFSGHWS